MEEIKACAHCGHKPCSHQWISGLWSVGCDGCGIMTTRPTTIKEAISAWNKREPDRLVAISEESVGNVLMEARDFNVPSYMKGVISSEDRDILNRQAKAISDRFASVKDDKVAISKEHFEANLLDGDKVENCGRATLQAIYVWEYLKSLASPAVNEVDKKVEGLIEALESLMDAQNGPPLISYTDRWNEAMSKAEQALLAVKRGSDETNS